jgi:succinate dehydrogenase/fumarate reductase cytochrome b subunit
MRLALRKTNAILSIILLTVFVLHTTAGVLLMTGVIPFIEPLQRALSWSLITAASAHAVIGLILTVRTAGAVRKSGASYFRDNLMFWASRLSGFAVIIFITLHVIIFSDRVYEPGHFGLVQLILSVLLSVAVLLHVLTSFKPLLSGLGILVRAKTFALTAFLLSALLLASAAAYIVFYINMSL